MKFRGLALFAVSWLALTTAPAYAYLDPGTGSILLQGLIGGIAAGFAVISINYYRAKAALARFFSSAKSDETNLAK
jgi:hypothetical protein